MTPSTALITGVTGQDGWYLSQLLLGKGYRVVGTARRQREVPHGVELSLVDVTQPEALTSLLHAVRPAEVYHLAADSSVELSWENPVGAERAVVDATRHVIDACARLPSAPHVVVASSCDVFGGQSDWPQRESTPLKPLSPYGKGKAAALELVRLRRREGQSVSAAILYNHESPRRPERFISRKVSLGAASIATGRAKQLALGTMDVRRDWGFAGDYVEAMWRMAQREVPDDYVIGTGAPHTVGDLCEAAFSSVGLDYREFVVTDPQFVRPVDPGSLVADPALARRVLDWVSRVSFADMIAEMVAADMARVRGETP